MVGNHLPHELTADSVVRTRLAHVHKHRLQNRVCLPLIGAHVFRQVDQPRAAAFYTLHVGYAACLFNNDPASNHAQRGVGRIFEQVARHRDRRAVMRDHLRDEIL